MIRHTTIAFTFKNTYKFEGAGVAQWFRAPDCGSGDSDSISDTRSHGLEYYCNEVTFFM